MSNLVKRKNGKPTSDCSVRATFAKALKANSEWTDKDEFLDVVYWLRQILGLILGVVWGVLPLKGFLGIVLFVAVNITIVYVYTNMFQRVNDDDYGGISEILKEGFMTSFATFVVTWIIVYSSLYRHDDAF